MVVLIIGLLLGSALILGLTLGLHLADRQVSKSERRPDKD